MLEEALRSISLRDLEAISVLSRTLHFGRAADEVGMAQSSLSALVQRFEEAVGSPVFARTSRRVAVAPEGAAILETVERTLREADRLGREGEEADELSGWVRLGAIPTLGPYLIPHILPPLMKAFPAARFLLTEALTEQLTGSLHAGRVDAALMTLPIQVQGLDAHPLFEEELVLALPAGHPLAKQDRIARSDVPTGDLILMDHGHCLRDNTLQVCGGTTSSVPTHATGVETLLAMVASGVGCAVVPALAVGRSRGMEAMIVFRALDPPVPTRTIGLVRRASGRGDGGAGRLLEVLRGLEIRSGFPAAPEAR